MGKRIIAPVLAFLMVTSLVHAADGVRLEISAEMKTGIIWDTWRSPEVGIHHNDYAGGEQGRFRMDMHLGMANLGVRARFEQAGWGTLDNVGWDWAFAYGNFIDDSLRVSIGRLSDSPWRAGRGGDEIWQGLDHQIGIRTEIRPRVVPGLNVGFTLNQWNSMRYWPGVAGTENRETITAMLMETVFGVAYEHANFYGRFSWRLDSDADVNNHDQEGHSMMYRLEPRIITNLVPDLRVWAYGWWRGVGPRDIGNDPEPVPDDQVNWMNWLHIRYEPWPFAVEFRLGVELTGLDSHIFRVMPTVYYQVLSFLRASLTAEYQMNFGSNAVVTGVPFLLFGIEPEIRFQFVGSSYLALVYRFQNDYNALMQRRERQWFNLRAVIAF